MECDTLTAVHARQYAAINYTHIFANISSHAHTCAVPVCKRVVMILCHNWNIPCCDDGPIHCVACVGLHDFTPPDVVLSMGRVKHSVSMHVWIQGNNGVKCSLSAARIFWLAHWATCVYKLFYTSGFVAARTHSVVCSLCCVCVCVHSGFGFCNQLACWLPHHALEMITISNGCSSL